MFCQTLFSQHAICSMQIEVYSFYIHFCGNVTSVRIKEKLNGCPRDNQVIISGCPYFEQGFSIIKLEFVSIFMFMLFKIVSH